MNRAYEFKLITERPARYSVDSENALIRQRGHAKSEQITINGVDHRYVSAAASAAAAALQHNEVKAEQELLPWRGHEEPLRLQRL